MVLMIKPFNKHIASLMVIDLQLSSPNTFCLNTSFVFCFALSAMLYLICFICYALSPTLYLLHFVGYALSAMLFLPCFICYNLSAMLYPLCFSASDKTSAYVPTIVCTDSDRRNYNN